MIKISHDLSIKKIDLILSIVFILFIIAPSISNMSSNLIAQLFGRFNEFIEVLLVALFIINININKKIKRINRNDIKILIYMILIIIIGLVSNWLFGIQTSMIAIMIDILLVVRFTVGYLSTFYCFSSKVLSRLLTGSIKYISEVFAVAGFILMIHDVFFKPWFNVYDYRGFFRSIGLIYGHPSILATYAISLVCILFSSYEKDKRVIKYIHLLNIIIVSTMRSKAIAFVGLFYIIYFCIFVVKIKSFKGIFAISGFGAICIGWKSIQSYFCTTAYSPRLIMLKDSIKLTTKHFPLGTGFATFGSFASVMYYSNLYYQLGYNNMYGLGSGKNSMFLNDTFWPTLLAQFGVFATIMFVMIIIILIKRANLLTRYNKCAGVSAFLLIANLIILSTSEPSFFNSYALLQMIAYAAIMKGFTVHENPNKLYLKKSA